MQSRLGENAIDWREEDEIIAENLIEKPG